MSTSQSSNCIYILRICMQIKNHKGCAFMITTVYSVWHNFRLPFLADVAENQLKKAMNNSPMQ